MRNNSNPKLLVSKAEATEKIQDRINIGKELLETPIYSEDELNNLEHKTEKWTDYNIRLFKTLFAESPLSPWIHGHKMVRSVHRENQVYYGTEEHKRYLANWINDLESIHEQLELYEETTPIREKLHHTKTEVIARIKGIKKDIPAYLKAIILSIIAGVILFYIGC